MNEKPGRNCFTGFYFLVYFNLYAVVQYFLQEGYTGVYIIEDIHRKKIIKYLILCCLPVARAMLLPGRTG
jgi:hypothetical protein